MVETVMIRAHMSTRPGMYAQYDGHVDCVADPTDRDDVFRAAVRRLRATSFPDYGASMWRLISFEVV